MVKLLNACINEQDVKTVLLKLSVSICFFFSVQENSLFIDTRKICIIKKKVRKLEDQLEYESRRWVFWLIHSAQHYYFCCNSFSTVLFYTDVCIPIWSFADSHPLTCMLHLHLYTFTFFLAYQALEGRNIEPKDERHWCSHRGQAPSWGETAGWGQGKEGEGGSVGDKSELASTLACCCF